MATFLYEAEVPRHMTFGSLFAGIGGFDLGLERAGMTCRWQVEKDPYCLKVLAKHWPDVPRYEDVKDVGKETLEPVDLICGGFPCQPFSTASHGVRVVRDLWPEMFRILDECRPHWVIVENVAKGPIKRARQDLRGAGYECCCSRRIGAVDAGADHQRHRWWLIAHTDNQSELPSAINEALAELPKLCKGVWGAENYARAIRVSNGVPHRVDRLRALGNAVVPQIVEMLGKMIMEVEANALGNVESQSTRSPEDPVQMGRVTVRLQQGIENGDFCK